MKTRLMSIKNHYKPLRSGKLKPYTLKYLLSEGLVGTPLNPSLKVVDFEFYNSGIVDVLLEYPGGHFYTIEAPEKLKHLIVDGKINMGDSISFLYDRNRKGFEVVKVC